MNPFLQYLKFFTKRFKWYFFPHRILPEEERKEIFKDFRERIKKLLPDETVEGQPFWGLMELSAGKITGNYFVMPVKSPDFTLVLPLFLRETDAEIFRSTRQQKDIKGYVVRGFTQEQLRLLTFPDENAKLMFWVFQMPPKGGGTWPCLVYNAKDLAKDFLK